MTRYLAAVIQAFGLTSDSRKDLPPSVDDVSFEAHGGRVTALLGTAGSGKTTTLRLMLELQQGCGTTYFKGRPLHRIAHPSREVGVLLGDVPGHPARTVRGHLRMLCAAAGLPVRRADEVLEVVGLVSFSDERLGTLSRGMDRRLGLACVMLADPHTLVLDAPADGLSVREGRWLHGVLRAHANQGGTVLFTTADPKEAARTADRVVTLERGRLVADQEAADFARHRLRPRVSVRSPHAARLGALLAKEARTARRSVEVVRETGNRLSVYGSTCADVGEAAFRHGILVHQLAHEVGDMGAGAGAAPSVADVGARLADSEEGGGKEGGALASSPTDGSSADPHPGERSATRRPKSASSTAQGLGSALELRTRVASPAAHKGSLLPAAGPGDGRPATRTADGADLTTGSGGPGTDADPGGPVALTADGASGPTLGPGGAGPAHGYQAPATATGSEGGTVAHASLPLAPANGSEAPGTTAGFEAPGSATAPEARDSAVAPEARDSATAPGALNSTVAPEARGSTTGSEPKAVTAATPDVAGTAPCSVGASSLSEEPSARAETPDEAASATTRPGQPPATRRTTAHPVPAHHPAPVPPTTGHPPHPHPSIPTPRPAETAGVDASSPLPPPISVRPGASPLRPLRYELRRATGVGTGFYVSAAVVVCSVLTALVMGRMGHAPQPRLLAAWPRQLPLPPAALGAGLLGAFAFGDEFRHPALAADRGTVPRRLGLLAAKLTVATATALVLAFLTVGCDAEVLYAVYGQELARVPGDWFSLSASWLCLVAGCAWAGVLAAGVFRSTTAGLAAVLSVPVLVVPLVEKALGGRAWDAAGLPARLRRVHLLQWPFGGDSYVAAAARLIAQPLGGALALTLGALLCAYLLTALRSRTR
ncbi:ATP-binding cassette domain-containing protein [Streptomyces sp. NPDC017179]|uniref:ATP-binding cassette domain-containing protein n=1 Tax=Streptomyces sp. NPDC017179 TaxID=3364979 RepID=UPI0037BBE482